MRYVYCITNTISGTKYYGITSDVKRRWAVHKYCHKRTKYKTPLYDAMRSYGFDVFVVEVIDQGNDEYVCRREVELIASDPMCYNLHSGGRLGFDVRTKDSAAVASWVEKLSRARKGRKPALGMKHTDETKRICGEYSRQRWDKHGRYPKEVMNYGFTEANKKFGISKTHYYRLKKR